MRKLLPIICLSFLLPLSSFAIDMDDFDAEDEGRLATKIRAFGSFPNSKQHDLPTPAPAQTSGTTPGDNEDIVNIGGGGLEFATEMFVSDNIAIELAVGVGAYSTNQLTNVAANYKASGGSYATAASPSLLWFVPGSFMLQYFIAPFGAISPYVGVGYNYTLFVTMSSEYNIANTHGPVIQAGIDFVTRDDTVYSLDIKRYFQQPVVTYQPALIAKDADGNFIKSNLKDFNPWVVSLNIGWKF